MLQPFFSVFLFFVSIIDGWYIFLMPSIQFIGFNWVISLLIQDTLCVDKTIWRLETSSGLYIEIMMIVDDDDHDHEDEDDDRSLIMDTEAWQCWRSQM